MTLPATAASISSRKGIATAANTSPPSRPEIESRPLPSAGIWCAFAISPRNVVDSPLLMLPAKAASISVAPAITNQVETSWLLTTSPRLIASSSRFCVGSCERSVSCWSPSSAIYASRSRREFAQHDFDVVDEGRHHRADHQEKDDEANQDRKRHADEEHLHLRHQPRQHA